MILSNSSGGRPPAALCLRRGLQNPVIHVAIFRRASVRVANCRRWMYSTLISELKLSAAALSSADPTRPNGLHHTQAVTELVVRLGRVLRAALWKIVAAKLHLSESTVRNYLSSAIGKTGTRNRMEAMREARQQGWL